MFLSLVAGELLVEVFLTYRALRQAGAASADKYPRPCSTQAALEVPHHPFWEICVTFLAIAAGACIFPYVVRHMPRRLTVRTYEVHVWAIPVVVTLPLRLQCKLLSTNSAAM